MKKEYPDVVFIDRKNTYVAEDVIIEKNVIIYPGNYIDNGSVIKENVTLLPNNYISGSVICKGAKLHSSVVENSIIGECSHVGPYTHLRPKTKLGKNVRVGNFCELKNATIGDGTKISHLSYVGDGIVGKNCNIGCGAIFVNYNGAIKSNIHVGDNVFIGSNVNLIAPIVLADNSYVCAGTTLANSTSPDDFVIARPDVITKTNYATNFLKRFKRDD